MQRATIPAQRVVREMRFRIENSDHLRQFSPRSIWPGSFARSSVVFLERRVADREFAGVDRRGSYGVTLDVYHADEVSESGFYVIPGQSAMGGTFGGQA